MRRLAAQVIALFILLSSFALAGDMDVVFLDVGKGDAIFINTPEGRHILIDTGLPDQANRIKDFLRNYGVKQLDYLIITHPHNDHAGSASGIVESFNPSRRYDNGQELDIKDGKFDPIEREYIAVFRKTEDDRYSTLARGQELELRDLKDIKITVLAPFEPESDANANSIVLKVCHTEVCFLLMGDAPFDVEKELMKREADLNVKVLKVGHHGYSDSTGPGFVNAVKPEYAVISVDRNNRRGAPTKEVLYNLKGFKVLKTSDCGNIWFRTDGHELTLRGNNACQVIP